jgi:hypothetical protein
LYEQVLTNTNNSGRRVEYSYYFLEKSTQFVKVGWTSYKDDIKSVLTDDPETTKKIDAMKITELQAFIQAFVNNYNSRLADKNK